MIIARRIVLVLIALVLVGPAPAGWAQGGDDAVVAVNTKDGSQVFRFSFNVRRIMGDVVDTGNAAVAFASCEGCQTIAISIQLVLVSGSPEVVTPENLAIAINEGCIACETLASAYQFVLGVGSAPVHFTSAGNRTLAELRQELARLRQGDLTIEETQARVEAIVDRLRDVLASELVAATPSGTGDADAGATTQPPETTSPPTTAPPPTDTTEPPPPTDTQTTTTETEPTTTETEPTTTTTTETEPPPTETTETTP